MRKLPLFSAMLILFLLVPASITWAQTVSLTGVVYENNTAKIPFKVPEGKITVYLTDDMAAGNIIRGTVSLIPDGKNEKAKRANLLELGKYAMFWPDDIPIRATASVNHNATGPVNQYTFSGKIPDTKNNSVPLQLKDAKGNTVSQAVMPLIRASSSGQFDASQFVDFATLRIDFEVQKKVITSGENIVLQKSSPILVEHEDHAMMAQFSINNKEVTPVCSSPRQTVIAVPPGTTGKTSVVAKDNNGKIIFEDEVYVVGIRASIGKTNLQKNERTSLHVIADGVKDCPYPLSMVIVNNASEIIVLDKGAHQTYQYNPAFESMRDGIVSSLDVHEGVTGVTPGAYNITANLILPATAFGDVFHQQKSALKTPEDYNAWVDALKKDLKAYADKQGTDEVGKAAKANAQRAIDNISKCFDKNKLDELKAFADAYLQPVKVPMGAATMWVCGFEAYKAAIKAITGTLGGKPELIDWEVIKNGLEFIRNMGEQLNDEGLQSGAKYAKKMVETIQKAGETKEKLQELKNKLDELNPAMKGKMSYDPEQIHNYTINDLQVSGFVHDFQPSFDYTGTGNRTVINIDGKEAGHIFSLERINLNEIKMELAMSESTCCYEWMKYFLNGQPLRKSGSISHVKIDNQPGSALEFKNAMITEVSFPKMNAAAKDMMLMGFTFKAEEIRYTATSDKVKITETKPAKPWIQSNFKIELGDLPGASIAKLEIPKITQKIAKDFTGFSKEFMLVPGKLEYPNITFYVSEADIKPWMDWYNNFEKNNETKNGEIKYVNENGESLFSVPLNHVKPVVIDLSGNGIYRVAVKPEAPHENRPDPVKDLIGYLDPVNKSLFVIPEYQPNVLEMLGAKSLPNGQYQINSLTANRKPITYNITIFASTPGLIFDPEKGFTEAPGPDESRYKNADATFKDSNGTECKFYKDAICGEALFKPWKSETCAPHDKFEYDSKTNEGKLVPDGKYYKHEGLGRRFCEKGNSFCVEMYLVVGLNHIYEDKNCTRLIDVEKIYNFTCQ